MRKTRSVLVGALALGAVLVTGSVAQAQTGDVDNTSSVEAGISPNFQNSTRAGAATLTAQVQTFDADSGPLTIVSKAAERVEVHFDNDLQLLPGQAATKFDQCGGQGGSDLDGASTSQAIAECSDAIVGSGYAEAIVPTGAPPPAPPTALLELTVTTFNGPTTVPGGACVTPGDGVGGPEGCEYVGGQPQIILHAYEPNVPFVTTVGGEIRNSNETAAGGEPYGKALIVNDAPDTAGDVGSLILFGSTVGAQIDQLKVKRDGSKREVTKLKQHNYFAATCNDDGAGPATGGLEYDFRGEWVYDDGTTDADTFRQKCGNETSTPAP